MASWGSYDQSRYYEDKGSHSRSRHESRSANFRPAQRSYDPRYSYPPPPTAPRDTSRLPRSPARPRRRWPPNPIVEEERDALQKEAASARRKSPDDVTSRGTIDQEPIIMDAEPPATDDRRFVWLGSDSESTKGNPTPPSSDDERVKRGRRKAPRLETLGLPEMMRTASPYAFTKPTPLSHHRSSGEFMLSPENLTPPSTATSQPTRRPPTSVPTPRLDPQRQASFTGRSDSSLRNTNVESVFDEQDLESQESASKRSQRKSVRYSFTRQDIPVNSRTSTLPPPPARPTPVNAQRPRLSEDSRRYTDSSTDRISKPAPLKVASLVHEALHAPSYPPPGRTSNANVSGRDSVQGSPHISAQYPPSPPRSPRASLDRPRDVTSSSRSTPVPTSREDSLDASPHGSPRIPPTVPPTESSWSSAFALNAARKTRPGSRLSSSTVQDPDPRHSSPSIPLRPSANLPYPVDDTFYQLMPEEKDHQYFPEPTLEPPHAASKIQSRSGTPVITSSARGRPALQMRHSLGEGIPISPATLTANRQPSSTTTSKTTPSRTAPTASTVILPPCPRPEYTSGMDDWYTLDDCPGFDICPDCLESVFSNTIHRAYFRRTSRRPPSFSVKCDFSDAWVRLAWLLTLQRQLPNLNLLKSLANHNLLDDQPCPGKDEAIRNWYTIRDASGRHLRDFTVCASDVRKLEILLPALRGVFVPLPIWTSSSYSNDDVLRKCALFTANNNRFPLYLDNLISLHETATTNHRPLDLNSFTTLVKHKTSFPACTRDDMLIAQPWHFIPSLPAFTICPDCFSELIEPALRADSDVAMRFNRTPQLLPREHHIGASCQLYSPRMRRVWKRAVEDGDLRYLSRKAKERKEIEEVLQERVAEVRKRAARLEWIIARGEGRREAREEEERLQGELDKAAEEWMLWE